MNKNKQEQHISWSATLVTACPVCSDSDVTHGGWKGDKNQHKTRRHDIVNIASASWEVYLSLHTWWHRVASSTDRFAAGGMSSFVLQTVTAQHHVWKPAVGSTWTPWTLCLCLANRPQELRGLVRNFPHLFPETCVWKFSQCWEPY